MSLRNWSQKEVTGPRGAWSQSALARKGSPSRASVAQNVRFFNGMAYSREGTSNVLAVAGAVAGMYDWITPTDHLLPMMVGTAIVRYRFSDASMATLQATLNGAYAPSFADLATRLYFTAFSTAGTGTIQCNVYDGSFTFGSPNVDTAFRGPIQFTMTASDFGVGNCTAGTHKIGFIFQSRSGFAGLPSPVDGGGVFQPLSITLNAGLRQIEVSGNINTPADAGPGSAFYPIITRADNPSKYYFVPDTFQVLPASQIAWPVIMLINVSDEDLAASAEDATDQFSVLTQDSGGNGPFNPQAVAAYGLRMCYLVGNQLYVSEINDPQKLAADRNVVQLLNQRRMATLAAHGQNLILYGDKWTGSVTDNGDEPATWAQPSTISDAIGAPFPNCVVSKTAGAYHWVISEGGVYVFDGSYPNRPITYLEGDNWARINWSAAYAIQAADDVVGLRLSVSVPLDDATVPTHVFTIDYTNGLTYDTCDITLDNFGFGNFRSLAMVKEQATNRTALWVGPAAAGNIVHLDPTTHNDANGTAIHAIWESGYVRDGSDGIRSRTVRVGGADIWARGSGSLIFTAYGLDRQLQVGPDSLVLAVTPGVELFDKIDLNPVENYTFRFETNAVGSWFQLSGFRSYSKASVYNR